MSASLSHATFLAQLHSKFQLQTDTGESVELELSEVSPLARTGKQELFSITLRGPGAFVLEQATFRLDHAGMGTFDIFLVPVSRDSQGVYYEAVFNRLI